MKKIIFFFYLFMACTVYSFAQASASSAVSATIVTPITITKSVDMIFGNIAVQEAAGGTVILAADGVRTSTGGVKLPLATGTFSAATFIVSGAPDYTYSIEIPSSDIIINDGNNSMRIHSFNSDPHNSGSLTGGSQSINIGATIDVGAGQNIGTYIGVNAFEIIVNYN